MAGPYVYPYVDKLENQKIVGSGQCVALVQVYARVPHNPPTAWKKGEAVKGNMAIAKGTAIATFINGIYPSHGSGNHAAFYLSQDAVGIWVMEQNTLKTKMEIGKRHIMFRRGIGNPSNDGDAYSVIL